jgi:low temperature requirement protein LtrA
MSGFAFPGMGRSSTQDWTIEGGHLTERCQLFVIVALGETLLASGGSLASSHEWTFPVLSAMTATFLSAMAVWWLYFGTSGEQATQAITHSADPGRMGAMFHYIHVILVGGIIVMAVGNDLTQEDPEHSVTLLHGAVICAGSIIFLIGSAIYKRVVYGTLPLTHILGALVLCLSVGIIEQLTLEQAGWLTTIIMLITAFAESRVHRHRMMKMKGVS